MYRLSHLWEQQPVAIAEAIRAVILVAVLLGLLQLSTDQLAAIVLAVSLILSLFVRQTVDSGATAREKEQEIQELEGVVSGQQALIDGRAGIPPIPDRPPGV